MKAMTLQADNSAHEQRRRIVAAVQDLLRRSAYYAVRRVSCEFDGNVLTLRGRVSSYYEKQIAQSLVLQQMERPLAFENQLEVASTAAAAAAG